MRFQLKPGGSITGRLRVPGDKSMSHRTIMLGSIAEGRAIVGVADLVLLASLAGLVAGGSVAWFSYVLARPHEPAEDTELLA